MGRKPRDAPVGVYRLWRDFPGGVGGVPAHEFMRAAD